MPCKVAKETGTTLIVPKRNAADLDDVPASVLSTMKIVLVETVDEVLAAALCLPSGEQEASPPPRRRSRKKLN